MESIGDTLRETRHNKKISIEDASRATRIKIDILERLEANEFDHLAAPAYAKGFLKIYAEYLGLDSQPLVDAYLSSQGGLRRQGLQFEKEKAIRTRKPRELQLSFGSIVLLVVGLTIAGFLVVLGRNVPPRRAASPKRVLTAKSGPAVAQQTAAPTASFDAYYQPKSRPAPELLEPPRP